MASTVRGTVLLGDISVLLLEHKLILFSVSVSVSISVSFGFTYEQLARCRS